MLFLLYYCIGLAHFLPFIYGLFYVIADRRKVIKQEIQDVKNNKK